MTFADDDPSGAPTRRGSPWLARYRLDSVSSDLEDAGMTSRADRPRRVGLVSVHTSPLAQPGTGDSGGMNVYIISLARHLAAQGVGVDIFTRAAGADLPPTVEAEPGVRLHHIEAGHGPLSKTDLASHLCAFYLGLAAHPAVEELDLLHGHYWMSGWVARRAKRRLGLPLVQSFHTLGRAKNDSLPLGAAPEPALRLTAEDRVVADADAVIAPTPGERALLVERYGARAEQIHLVEPGVDLDVFRADTDPRVARQAVGGGRIVLFVGRLQPLKAPHLAVRTLAALDAALPDDGVPTRLVAVGGASGQPDTKCSPEGLMRLAEELGVADRVAFLAPRAQAELSVLYRAADALLVPSYSESFGLAALEAQACGTPVVGSSVSGLAHVLAGGGATLVDDHDPESFAAALLPYLTDPEAHAAAAARGRDRAAGFTWTRTASETLAVYRGVLADASNSVTPLRRTGTGP